MQRSHEARSRAGTSKRTDALCCHDNVGVLSLGGFVP